jgi:hypothetical protein
MRDITKFLNKRSPEEIKEFNQWAERAKKEISQIRGILFKYGYLIVKKKTDYMYYGLSDNRATFYTNVPHTRIDAVARLLNMKGFNITVSGGFDFSNYGRFTCYLSLWSKPYKELLNEKKN